MAEMNGDDWNSHTALMECELLTAALSATAKQVQSSGKEH